MELPFSQTIPGGELSAAAEHDTRTRHQINDRVRHQHLAGKCTIGDSARDLDGHAGENSDADLAFAGMDARPDVDARVWRRSRERVSTVDGACGPLEAHQEAVARGPVGETVGHELDDLPLAPAQLGPGPPSLRPIVALGAAIALLTVLGASPAMVPRPSHSRQ
jgi:hypothetical protein